MMVRKILTTTTNTCQARLEKVALTRSTTSWWSGSQSTCSPTREPLSWRGADSPPSRLKVSSFGSFTSFSIIKIESDVLLFHILFLALFSWCNGMDGTDGMDGISLKTRSEWCTVTIADTLLHRHPLFYGISLFARRKNAITSSPLPLSLVIGTNQLSKNHYHIQIHQCFPLLTDKIDGLR